MLSHTNRARLATCLHTSRPHSSAHTVQNLTLMMLAVERCRRLWKQLMRMAPNTPARNTCGKNKSGKNLCDRFPRSLGRPPPSLGLAVPPLHQVCNRMLKERRKKKHRKKHTGQKNQNTCEPEMARDMTEAREAGTPLLPLPCLS